MRLAIYGAGSTGCYLGGLLKLCGHDVSLICRERIKNAIVEAEGITLRDFTGQNVKVMPDSLITTLDTECFDAVFVTLKCYQLESALPDLKKQAERGCECIFMQNGLGSFEQARQSLPPEACKQGITPFNVLSLPGAVFHRGTAGSLIFEESSVSRLVAPQLEKLGFETQLFRDMRPVVYGKLLLNLNNALNAIADVPIKQQLEDRRLRTVLARAQEEWLQVAQHEQVKLERFTKVAPKRLPFILKLPNWLFLRLAKSMLEIDPQARSSMWEDIQAQRKTEIEYLNLAVATKAKVLGLRAPVNQGISELILKKEQGQTTRLEDLYALLG